MTSFPYKLGRNDTASAVKIQRMDDEFKDLAAFINAEPDEIGTYLPYLPYLNLCFMSSGS